MLQLEKAQVSAGPNHYEFTLQASPGEVVAIVGKSGAGKSTLLNLIGGFLPLDAGTITWNGRSMDGLSPAQRPITCLFQDGNLFSHLSVRKNVALGINSALKLDTDQWTLVDQSLDEVGLSGFGSRRPKQLSGGEQQRVGLARCLVRQQPLLLLDEPYSALDGDTRRNMLGLTLQICTEKKLCTLMVSHNYDDASALSARMVEIRENRLYPI